MPVQAAEAVYGVLKIDGNIYETNADNTSPTETEITDKKMVTHLFAAADVTSISDQAFRDCTSLIEVKMPAVITIGVRAFQRCTRLTTVEFPKATTIGVNAFYYCSALTTVELPEVTTIGARAFYYCDTLTTVEFPAVSTIDYGAFEYCKDLATTEFPAVITIGEGAFEYCFDLTTIEFPKAKTVGSFAFSHCYDLATIKCPEATTVSSIAFYNCRALTTIEFPEVTTIGYRAFYECEDLTTVEFPKVKTIGDTAFAHCDALATVECPEANTIAYRAFYDCNLLTTAEFPEAVTIDDGAFYECNAFANLTLGVEPPTVGEDAFSGCLCTNLTIAGGNSQATVKEYEDADASEPQGYWYGWALSYPLTVNNGIVNEATVNGDYHTGTRVTITANEPKTGQRFKDWTIVSGGVIFANPKTQSTAFTMPGNTVEVSANYETIPVTRISFDANNGVGEMTPQQISEGNPQNLNDNEFTREDYSFKNWNTDKSGSGTDYDNKVEFSAEAIATEITLYAQWTENTFTISGRVEDDNATPLVDVEVKLMNGNTAIATAVTTAEGTFSFNKVPNGSYDLIISNSYSSVTSHVNVDNADTTLSTALILPSGKTSSEVEVKGDTPPIVVENLEQQFNKTDKEILANGGSVEIKLIAETKDNTELNAGNITGVATSNEKTIGMFIDLSVVKTIGSSTETMGELSSLIDIFIPLDKALQGKTDYVIYRYHDAAVEMITTIPNEQGEKIELVDGGKTIKLSAKKFSLYAIAYSDTTQTGGSSSNNPKTGNDRPIIPISATMGLIVLGFGLYIKTKVKRSN